MKYSAHEHLKIAHSLAPKSQAGAAIHYGTGILTKGFREALCVMSIGTVATGGTYAGKVQESDDDVTYTDVTGAAFTGVTDAAPGVTYVGRLDLRMRKKYLRFAGTDAVAAVLTSALFVLSDGQKLPVTQQQTVGFNV